MNKHKLSLVMITKNCEKVINEALRSVKSLPDEIIVVDDYSTDKTVLIAKKYKARVFYKKEEDFGKKRKYAVFKAKGDWILFLDTDERLSDKLKSEIEKIVKKDSPFTGYAIPYQNHFLGRPLYFGGENYRMIRLFRKNSIKFDSALVHEKFVITKGKVGQLKNKIYHYSYRSLSQMYRKFTDYALREARQKIRNSEKTNLKKIFIYPLHMLWARFIEDKGYKDGLFRIPLDLGFAYMEFLTYISMAFIRKSKIA